jgi:hypothetical protein
MNFFFSNNGSTFLISNHANRKGRSNLTLATALACQAQTQDKQKPAYAGIEEDQSPTATTAVYYAG